MKALIAAAQAGCTRARAELAEALRPRLNSMARYYARRGNLDYDDLLQEAWCAVFEALPETRLQIGAPQEYLLRRARWAILDYLKWSLRRQMAPLEDDQGEALTAERETETVLRLAVDRLAENLTPMQQNVLGLLMEGESCTTAAGKLGCTTANVSYHLGQVRRQMAGLFAEEEALVAT
jgi:RNA polymerase sigma factor (sigma-70 family)